MYQKRDIGVFDTDFRYIISTGGQNAYCALLKKSEEGMRRCEECDRRLLLRSTDMPVYEICVLVGMENYQYFCRRFKMATGNTPLGYRKNQRIEDSDK